MSFEEFPRALLVERNGLTRFFANTLQRGGNGCEFPSQAPPSLDRAAASQKGGKGGCVIVGGPALQAGPLDRLVLRVRQNDRPVALGKRDLYRAGQSEQYRKQAKGQISRRNRPH